MRYVSLLLVVTQASLGCGKSFDGPLSKPEQARVNISKVLSKFDGDSGANLFRYLSGNPRWEIREERGKTYAVRRERVDGRLATTLNGFYSSHDVDHRQTRVLLSFGEPYGFGVEHGNVTRTHPGARGVPVVIEGAHAGTPGNSSYLIVQGNGFNIEIYEQSPAVERGFTKSTLKQLDEELAAVLAHGVAIQESGILPVDSYYPYEHSQKASFTITDGMQPGIYKLRAHINPQTRGFLEARVFNSKTGQQLSKERLGPRSRRHVGWSNDGQVFFEYNSEVTVYEGDWNSQYEARFELWHVSNGTQSKMAEGSRLINGWQR